MVKGITQTEIAEAMDMVQGEVSIALSNTKALRTLGRRKYYPPAEALEAVRRYCERHRQKAADTAAKWAARTATAERLAKALRQEGGGTA